MFVSEVRSNEARVTTSWAQGLCLIDILSCRSLCCPECSKDPAPTFLFYTANKDPKPMSTPSFRFAADDVEMESLLEPLRELQGRFRLEVPESYVKEERIRESSDQQSASYVITWYDVENMKDDNDQEPLDLEPIIDELAEVVLGSKDGIEFSTEHHRRARHTFQTTVQVIYSGKKTAGFKSAQDIVPSDVYPVTLYVGEDVLGIDSDDGLDYRITENGDVLADGYGSAPDAFGALVTAAIAKLRDLEADKGREDQLTVEQDLLVGLSDYFLTSDTISDEAKGHLVEFVELVTNHDLASALEDRENNE